MSIGRELPLTIELSPERSREGTLEGQKALDNFEASPPLWFTQREIFNILVSERRLRHRDMHNKVNLTREFYT